MAHVSSKTARKIGELVEGEGGRVKSIRPSKHGWLVTMYPRGMVTIGHDVIHGKANEVRRIANTKAMIRRQLRQTE